MKYYLDQEFFEGFRKPISWLPTIGRFNKPYHFIDLISIGIVAEDGREYYAVSKDFNVKEVWNKYDLKKMGMSGLQVLYKKVYWLRENVLAPIFWEFYKPNLVNLHYVDVLSYSALKGAIKHSGKSNKQIAEDIRAFVLNPTGHPDPGVVHAQVDKDIEFYGYYADYDWVLFCSLFGRMIDLPAGFPMYCRDLKQMLDEEAEKWDLFTQEMTIKERLNFLKNHEFYPKQENEHNALSDAGWNKKLYEFVTKI